MRMREGWTPSKFVESRGGLAASSDPACVDVRSRLMVNLLAAAYEKAIVAHASGVLADLGCGRVPLYGVYAPLVSQVVCADWPQSLHKLAHVDCFIDLDAPLPFATGGFDTVLATDVVEHLSDPRGFVREVSRVLKIGGNLILGVPFLYWLHEEPNDHHRLTRHQLRRLCAETGLEVVHLEAYGGPLAVLFDIMGKIVPGAIAAGVVQFVGGRLLGSRIGDRLDRRKREQFPLGYCLVARKA